MKDQNNRAHVPARKPCQGLHFQPFNHPSFVTNRSVFRQQRSSRKTFNNVPNLRESQMTGVPAVAAVSLSVPVRGAGACLGGSVKRSPCSQCHRRIAAVGPSKAPGLARPSCQLSSRHPFELPRGAYAEAGAILDDFGGEVLVQGFLQVGEASHHLQWQARHHASLWAALFSGPRGEGEAGPRVQAAVREVPFYCRGRPLHLEDKKIRMQDCKGSLGKPSPQSPAPRESPFFGEQKTDQQSAEGSAAERNPLLSSAPLCSSALSSLPLSCAASKVNMSWMHCQSVRFSAGTSTGTRCPPFVLAAFACTLELPPAEACNGQKAESAHAPSGSSISSSCKKQSLNILTSDIYIYILWYLT